MGSLTRQRKQRIASDYYPTPSWCVDHLFEIWHPPGGIWLEPGAGDGAIIRAVERHRTDVNWIAAELRTDATSYLTQLTVHNAIDVRCPTDFLRSPLEPVDVVIGNPPYTLAEEFARKALKLAPHVALLLRSSFDGSAERIPFHRMYKGHKEILPKRPKFDGSGCDMHDSAWFVWGPDRLTRLTQTWDIRPLSSGQLRLF